MVTVTISLSDRLLNASREYAQRNGTTLDALIGDLLERTLRQSEGKWPDAFLAALDEAGGDSKGWKWNREEIQRHGERDDLAE
ncbi:MAG: hypothetical protein ACODAJ_16160 [Planctomycetota bacterium]